MLNRIFVWLWRAWQVFVAVIILPVGSVAWATDPLVGPLWFGILVGLMMIVFAIFLTKQLMKDMETWRND